jgi:cobalamin biosynthesis protein CbiD
MVMLEEAIKKYMNEILTAGLIEQLIKINKGIVYIDKVHTEFGLSKMMIRI